MWSRQNGNSGQIPSVTLNLRSEKNYSKLNVRRRRRFGEKQMHRYSFITAAIILCTLCGCGSSSSEGAPPSPGGFIVCKSTYALCTGAPCTAIPGNDQDVSCACIIQTGYSAATTMCQPPTVTPQGLQVISRYFPIRSYAPCSNSRPWANCLDSACIVDPGNSSYANCTCSIEQNQGDYLAVNAEEQYNSASCTTGILSSATVTDANALTNSLKHNPKLRPFPIKVLNPQ